MPKQKFNNFEKYNIYLIYFYTEIKTLVTS